MIDLSIIIINYNSADLIENCVDNIIENIGLIKYEIIIFDNASDEADKLKLQSIGDKYPSLIIKYSNVNFGFGKGCNYAVRFAGGNVLGFINPDLLIKEEIFSSIINRFDKNQSSGAIGPNQNNDSKNLIRSCGIFPNLFVEFLNIFFIGKLLDTLLLRVNNNNNKNTYLKVDWISGSALFVKRSDFNLLNGFDESFFMFYEDVDLCRRLVNLGKINELNLDLKSYHIGSSISKKNYKLFTSFYFRSKLKYFKKHYSQLQFYLFLVLFYLQIITQVCLWIILLPFNWKKSFQKIEGFISMLVKG